MAKKDNENQLRALEALAKTGNVLAIRKKGAGKGAEGETGQESVTGQAPAEPRKKRGGNKKTVPGVRQGRETAVQEAEDGSIAGTSAGEKPHPAPVRETERQGSRKPGKTKKCHASFLLRQELCDEIEKQAEAGLKENTKTAFIEVGTDVVLRLPPDVYFRLKTEAYEKGVGFTAHLASVLEEHVKNI